MGLWKPNWQKSTKAVQVLPSFYQAFNDPSTSCRQAVNVKSTMTTWQINIPSTTPELTDIWPMNRYWAWIYPQSDCDEQVEDNGRDRIADWAKTGSQCNPLKWGMPWILVDFRDREFQLQSMNPCQNQGQIWNRIWIYVTRAQDRQNYNILLKGPTLPFLAALASLYLHI